MMEKGESPFIASRFTQDVASFGAYGPPSVIPESAQGGLEREKPDLARRCLRIDFTSAISAALLEPRLG